MTLCPTALLYPYKLLNIVCVINNSVPLNYIGMCALLNVYFQLTCDNFTLHDTYGFYYLKYYIYK